MAETLCEPRSGIGLLNAHECQACIGLFNKAAGNDVAAPSCCLPSTSCSQIKRLRFTPRSELTQRDATMNTTRETMLSDLSGRLEQAFSEEKNPAAVAGLLTEDGTFWIADERAPAGMAAHAGPGSPNSSPAGSRRSSSS